MKSKGNFEDIYKQKFAKLTAISYIGKSMWLCECECGNTITCRKDKLQNGKIKSCGCKNKLPKEDLTGRKFGKLKVIRYINKSMYECECECGEIIKAHKEQLLSGKSSCGCDRKNKKICVVCGKEFYCPPSDKTVCCSKECTSINRSQKLQGHEISDECRAKISAASKGRDMSELNIIAVEAAKKSPKSGRFETNGSAKDWVLYSPEGKIYEVTNIRTWAYEHVGLFGFDENDHENRGLYADRISHGFYTVKRNCIAGKGTVTYKDWCLYGWGNLKNRDKPDYEEMLEEFKKK